MEDLLRLLTNNPFLLFLIIGAILSFFQRGQKEQQETRRPKPLEDQPKQRTNMEEVDWREIFRQEASPPVPAPQPVQKQEPTIVHQTNELLTKYNEVKKDRKEPKRHFEQVKSPIFDNDLTKQDVSSFSLGNISTEDVMKGVIWSEILGEPRAKKKFEPHSTYSRRKQV